VPDASARAASRALDGRTVLAVFAHPDDESLACGGTLARLADAGARIVLLCASHGESGSVSDPALVPDGNLGRVRVHELREAAGVLGLAEVLVFDHPDGQLRWDDVPELHAEIVMVVSRTRPDVVITFDADGLYWHLDHVAVHERTTTAIRTFGADAPPLYYVTMPKGVMRELVAAALAEGGAPADSTVWGIEPDAFGDQAAEPTFVIDVREWVARKLQALRCHRTQMGPHNPFAWLGEGQGRRWLGIEQFRRAPIETCRENVLERLGEPVTSR
jgi:N-acetyl-1-D-myo-inositol-2-amino-2-deoxy-alpha-D-glucopyranoside deacetylase